MESILSYAGSQKQWNTKEDIEHVINDLDSNLNSIKTLQLSGNTLGVDAADKLTQPLSKQSKIERLLWNDLFTGRLKTEISVALKSLSLGLIQAKVNLVEVDLSDNAFGPHGVVGVTELLASPCCYTLKILNMNNQGLGHQGCRQLIDALKISRLSSNKKGMNLEVFIAGRNRLENAGMKMLTELFGDGMISLQKIVLLQNGIGVHGVEGVDDLIISLKNHKDLKVINISDNTIKPDGMKRLSKILPLFDKLEELHMDDCLISNSGMDCLTKNLDIMSNNLKAVHISGNEINGRTGRNFISTIVKIKHLIEKIDLTENEIKKSDWCEIKDIMAEYDKDHALVEKDLDSDENYSDNNTDTNSERNSSFEYTDESSESDVSEQSTTEDKVEIVETKEKNIFSSTCSNNKPFEFNINLPNSDNGNLFSSSSGVNNEIKSNLFTKSNQQNIFMSENTDSKFKFSSKPFSFIEAVNDIYDKDNIQLKQYVTRNLELSSLMDINESLMINNKNLSNNSFDSSIYKLAESKPENAIRVGLILCKNSSTFDFGVSLINYVLSSCTSWSKATNAILVEMDCIKSEEKHFVPVCKENDTLPIKVLENILDMKSEISQEVKSNLSVVLKNLMKKSNNATDDLLKKLESYVSDLKI